MADKRKSHLELAGIRRRKIRNGILRLLLMRKSLRRSRTCRPITVCDHAKQLAETNHRLQDLRGGNMLDMWGAKRNDPYVASVSLVVLVPTVLTSLTYSTKVQDFGANRGPAQNWKLWRF